jgi:predicted PurR-regulated permease PerM
MRPGTWFLAAALALSAMVVRPFVLELGVALVLGFVSERPIAWVLRRLGREGLRWRWGVATLFVVATVLVVFLPAAFAVWVAVRELARLLVSVDVPQLERFVGGLAAALRTRIASFGVTLPSAEIVHRAQSYATAAGGAIARFTGRALVATPLAFLSMAVVFVGWVTFAATGRAMRDAVLPVLIPWPREREILRRTTAGVIDSVVLANIGVAAVQASIVSVATITLGIPHAVVWGVASFAFAFVPVIGTSAITVGATVWLALAGRTGAAVAMGFVALVAGSIDNVLRPLLARNGIHLPFLWMLVAFVGGVTTFGLAGVVLGPLVLACTAAFWEARGTDPSHAG